MAAVIALLEDFDGRRAAVANSVCAVSVTVSSSHLFLPLKAQEGCDCYKDCCSVLTAPLLLE